MYTYYKMPIELHNYINSHLIDIFKNSQFYNKYFLYIQVFQDCGMLYHQRQTNNEIFIVFDVLSYDL